MKILIAIVLPILMLTSRANSLEISERSLFDSIFFGWSAAGGQGRGEAYLNVRYEKGQLLLFVTKKRLSHNIEDLNKNFKLASVTIREVHGDSIPDIMQSQPIWRMSVEVKDDIEKVNKLGYGEKILGYGTLVEAEPLELNKRYLLEVNSYGSIDGWQGFQRGMISFSLRKNKKGKVIVARNCLFKGIFMGELRKLYFCRWPTDPLY